MTALKKTPVAILVMIAVIALSSFLGCLRSLLVERRAVDAYFYNSNECIQGKLEIICALTNDFKTIALRYVDASDERIVNMVNARKALLGAESVREKYLALDSLYTAISTLYSGIDTDRMNYADRTFHHSRFDNITAVIQDIEKNPYNDAAKRFNEILDSFPAKYVARLTGFKPLELFGEYYSDNTDYAETTYRDGEYNSIEADYIETTYRAAATV